WLMLGDNVYNSGLDSEYQNGLFDVYPTMLRKSVLWPCIGNHDTNNRTSPTPGPLPNIFNSTTYPYFDQHSLPTAGEAGGVASGTENYFSFDYGNIHVVSLDSQISSRAANGPMALWLQS